MNKTEITQHLIMNNSYFKWSAKRLARQFRCTVRDVKSVVKELDIVKQAYLQTLRK